MRRVPLLLCAFGGFFVALAPSAYSDPPQNFKVTAVKADSSANCEAPCTASPVQRIRVEIAQPEVVIQQAGCTAKPCGILRCCHWLRSHCAPMTMPYAVAPAATYGVMPQAVQPMSFGVQPMSFGAQPMSFGVQPMSFGVQPTISLGVQPMSFGVQPMVLGVMPAGSAQGTPPSAQSTPAGKEDINDSLKQLNTHLQGLIKVVDRHHDYIVDHQKRLDDLTKRVQALEDWQKKNNEGKKTNP